MMKVFRSSDIQPSGLDEKPLDAAIAQSTPDFSLLERCRAGDEPAWKVLYEANFDFVYRVAKRLGASGAEVEDVCQDVFIVAFRKLGDFKEGQIRTWLYRITARAVSDRHRRVRVRGALQTLFGKRSDEMVVTATPERQVSSAQTSLAVGDILADMAPKKREVFALFELEGWTGEEIAEKVGCKLETVWTRLFHARREFRRVAEKRGLVP